MEKSESGDAVPLLDAGRFACRWIVQPSPTGVVMCCGAAVRRKDSEDRSPYCIEHSRLAFKPIQPPKMRPPKGANW